MPSFPTLTAITWAEEVQWYDPWELIHHSQTKEPCITANWSRLHKGHFYPWQSYPFTTSCLGRISLESCVHCLLIFHQISPCNSWYTKTQLPWTSNNSSCLLSQDFCVVTHKSRIGCRRRMTQRHPRSVTAEHSWARPLKTSPLQNHSFDFCVQHHAYTSVTAWLLKPKVYNLFCRLMNQLWLRMSTSHKQLTQDLQAAYR